jgi:hypothetical protein
MKYIIFITLLIAITAESNAQCSRLALFHKGAVITGTTYDSSGKEISKSTTTVTDVKTDNGVNVSTVTMNMISGMSKGGIPINVTYKCDGNNLYVDLGSMMGNFASTKNVKVVSKPMAFPINLSTGQTLPDADITVTMPRAGMNMTMTSMVRNRKVLGKETITTPAGTWTCYKVTSTIESKTDIDATTDAGKKMQEVMKKSATTSKTTAVMWFAPNFGIVRTIMYRDTQPETRSDVTAIKM